MAYENIYVAGIHAPVLATPMLSCRLYTKCDLEAPTIIITLEMPEKISLDIL